MLIEHQDRRFSVVRGSDVERDGMFLELAEAGSSFPLIEAFYSDSRWFVQHPRLRRLCSACRR